MKRIFLNKAIVSYSDFVKRVVNLKNNAQDIYTQNQYKKFLDYYRDYKSNEDIKLDVFSVLSCSGFSGMEVVKIYYTDIIQVWAFVHILVVKKTNNKNILKLSNMSEEDFADIKKTLHSLWYSPHHDETYEYVYLDEDDVTLELKCFNLKRQTERSSEILKKSVERLDCLFA